MNDFGASKHHARHSVPAPDLAVALLRPRLHCWRLARASRLATIVDAAGYFRMVRAALLQAEHSAMFIGWDFDTRIKLDPDHRLPG